VLQTKNLDKGTKMSVAQRNVVPATGMYVFAGFRLPSAAWLKNICPLSQRP
jgi:hypothetical protein